MREIIDIQRLQEKVLEKNREIIEENEFCSKVAKLWVASKGTSEQFKSWCSIKIRKEIEKLEKEAIK